MAVSAGNGNGARVLDRSVLRDEATQITDAVSSIVQMTDQVSVGADIQVQALDNALSGLNEMTASLRETASQAESVAGSTDSLVSSINEVSASIEQVTQSSESLAGFIRQTATAIQESSASI